MVDELSRDERLPANAAELRQQVAGLERLLPPPGFRLQPTDVVVATYPKCGTTWVQQIVHGLRTAGSMDFEEISLVVPWIETAPLLGIDLDAPQVAEPRAFKTHLSWDLVPKGGRYIYIVRNPEDALVSLYHFLNGIQFERDSIELQPFGEEKFLRPGRFGRYWEHLRSWWEQRLRDDVLFLCFEDMKRDHERSIRRVADFMGLGHDEARVAIATQQSTFEFMRAHQGQFDDQPMTEAMNRARGLCSKARTTKVRAGRVGDGAMLSPQLCQALAAEWERHIGRPLGIHSYDELRASLQRGDA